MDKKEVANKLGSLMQLDIDAAHAYGQAIEEINIRSIRDTLEKYRGDHERHINDLSAMITKMGETPPSHSRDVKGFLIEGFTAIRSATGVEGALKAMKTNEELTNKRYAEAMGMDMPADAKALVERNYRDEQQHRSYVEQAISNRIWEKEPAYTE